MVHNIAHIKAYWVMMTPRIAQIALRFGADDLDGTVGREPEERDTPYRPVTRTETAFTVLV